MPSEPINVVMGGVKGVSSEAARKYVDFDRHELSMILSWEHMYIDYEKNGTWDIKRWKLKELKKMCYPNGNLLLMRSIHSKRLYWMMHILNHCSQMQDLLHRRQRIENDK